MCPPLDAAGKKSLLVSALNIGRQTSDGKDDPSGKKQRSEVEGSATVDPLRFSFPWVLPLTILGLRTKIVAVLLFSSPAPPGMI